MSGNLRIVGSAGPVFLRSLHGLGLGIESSSCGTHSDVQVIGGAAAWGAVFLPLTAADGFEIARSGYGDRLSWRAVDPAVGWDRALVRTRLAARGLANRPWSVASDEAEARSAARKLPLPLSVSPAVPSFPAIERRVDDLADLSLATRVVRPYAADGRLVLEPFDDGACRCVLGWVTEGRFTLLMVVAQNPAAPHSRFPVALSGPSDYPTEMDRLVTEAVAALELERAAVRVTLREYAEGWQVAEVDLCPSPAWMPEDLPAQSGGTGFWELHARLALGDSPDVKCPRQGAALAWLSARSGQVSRVPANSELPDGCTLVCGVTPGDTVGHVLDVVSRNRLGYVVATGETTADAAQMALDCRNRYPIETRAVMDVHP